jgi:hypothetical protein
VPGAQALAAVLDEPLAVAQVAKSVGEAWRFDATILIKIAHDSR